MLLLSQTSDGLAIQNILGTRIQNAKQHPTAVFRWSYYNRLQYPSTAFEIQYVPSPTEYPSLYGKDNSLDKLKFTRSSICSQRMHPNHHSPLLVKNHPHHNPSNFLQDSDRCHHNLDL